MMSCSLTGLHQRQNLTVNARFCQHLFWSNAISVRYREVDRELIGTETHSFPFVLRKSGCLLGKIGEGVPSGRA
jgi:hypothetical protein